MKIPRHLRIFWACWFLVTLLSYLIPERCHAAGVVSVPDEAHLRTALEGGGTVSFNCDGTIYLANTIVISTDVVLDASGRNISISGSNAVRILKVNPAINLSIQNLTICDGFNTNGGGVFNAGNLQIRNSIVCSNVSLGSSGEFYSDFSQGEGGGIYNVGVITGSNVQFFANASVGGDTNVAYHFTPALPGRGGALFNLGEARFTNCIFTGNRALGVSLGAISGVTSEALGGAIFNGGTLTIVDSEFSASQAIGGAGEDSNSSMYPNPGGNGGAAKGGALFSSNSVSLSGCSFYSNAAFGGRGGNGNKGQDGQPAGTGLNGGNGGQAFGGSIFISQGAGSLVNCTFSDNKSQGGNGGNGGMGGAGTTGFRGWQGGNGGNGKNGGNASGGSISIAGDTVYPTINLTNVTIASGSATPGAGGAYGPGGPGGDYFGNFNPGANGNIGVDGVAYGGNLQNSFGTFALKNSIVAYAQSAGNGSGFLTDLGNNISSDSTCGFTQPSSLNDTDPMLAPLGDSGGPTKTMALLVGSPALDSGDSAASPQNDQRGVPRPQLSGPDIGAVEYSYARATLMAADQVRFEFSAVPGRDYSILVSSNLIQWSGLLQLHTSIDGVIAFDQQLNASQQFYRPLLLNP